MVSNNFNVTGLTYEQIQTARAEHGDNRLNYKRENGVVVGIKNLAKEPMIILLLLASCIYFVGGKTGDGFFLVSAIFVVSAITLYQDSRSRNALEKLKDFTQPKCSVVRNGEVLKIKTEDLVVGDSIMIEEGSAIPADGVIVHSNDFSVNESILTGESLSVFKDQNSDDHLVYMGTTVAGGLAIAVVTAIGNNTQLGKIGKSLESIKEQKTPLEIQINDFVKKLVISGAIVFVIVWAINYFRTYELLNSLLKALTLAMSILPEEIPMAFTTFMAIGAWRLMKMGVVVKQMKTVETLGSATVICIDKTGTLTENTMTLARLFVLSPAKVFDTSEELSDDARALVTTAMWASEPIPFDPMEVSLHKTYTELAPLDRRPSFKLIYEYPLDGQPPMMTHIFEDGLGNRIIAAKGAPEAIMAVSNLSVAERTQLEQVMQDLASDGYRILAVGEATFAGNNFPQKQQEFQFSFKGIVAFYDPPKKNIRSVLEDFYKAGISVKIITGDNAATTAAIAKQIGFNGYDESISGDRLMLLSSSELGATVINTNIFTRMFPEAKLKIVNALKQENEIVARTGDGVNDGPALKAAHIGIAMGKKGTEIARQAASLILLEDDLTKMVAAIAMGRRIYTNLKKAIQYIISIHIPIILTVFVPLALRWIYPNIFSPVHIIFFELIMGPTCSIMYENEPMEQNAMHEKPRHFATKFFNNRELTTSIVQGLAITLGSLFTYRYAVSTGADEATTRTMVFTVLLSANILLTLVNRSFYYSVITTMKYKNNLVLLILGITILLSAAMLYIKPLTTFFDLEQLTLAQLSIAIGIGFLSVAWYEVIKWAKRYSAVRP
jgi:Ca2+-transporting ATPase